MVPQISMSCPATNDCKILYGDLAAAPDTIFVDCPDETCGTGDTPGTCASGGRTCTNINTDYGSSATIFHGDIDCRNDATDCKVIYFDDDAAGGGDLLYMDCDDAVCGTSVFNAVIVAGINDRGVGQFHDRVIK